MISWKAKATVLLLVFFATSCTKVDKKIPISGQYGSIAYFGTVIRKEIGHDYEFTIDNMTLFLRPNSEINATQSVVNPSIRLATITRPSSQGRAVVTSETSYPLSLTLDMGHLSAQLHNMRFIVNKQKVLDSAHTGLSLSDGQMLWPIATELKP